MSFSGCCLTFAVLASLLVASHASAQLVYVEARDQLDAAQNIFNNIGGPIDDVNYLDPVNSPNASNPANGIWNYRDEGASPDSTFATIYEAAQEDAPELMVKINSGLTAGTMYDVYVVYWSDAGDWTIRAGFASNPGANPVFNRQGGDVGTAGTFAGNAIWASPPVDNPNETVDDPSPFINLTDLDDPNNDPTRQDMFLGLVGTTTATAGGVIDVFVDDLGTDGAADSNQRTWLDGLAFVPAGSSVFVDAAIDRDTGSLTFNNPTGVPLEVVSYSITSPAGALDQTQWAEIATGESNITQAGWTVTSPSGTSVLELAENGPAATIPANGGTLELGNVFNRTPYEDVTLNINLSNGQSLPVSPTYTGTTLSLGDFDADFDIDIDDYTRLQSNMFNPAAPTSTLVEAYQMGDITQDNVVNGNDFIAFRIAYEAVNGVGSFQAMLNAIPEPSTGLMALAGLALLGLRRSRRIAFRVPPTTIDDDAPKMIHFHTHARLRACVLSMAVLTLVFASGKVLAQTTPVTGWFVSSSAAVTNGETNSPTIGDGTANNADNTTIWAALADPVTLANGEEVVLTGSVQLIGVDPGGGDGMRIGLFDGNNWFDSVNNPTYDGITDEEFNAGTVPAGWAGFLATAASSPSAGAFDAKNPNYTGGAGFNGTNFVSTFEPNNLGLDAPYGTSGVMVPGEANAAAKIIRLGSGAPVSGSLVDGSYDFELRVGRFGDENTMSVRVVSQDTSALGGDFDGNGTVNGKDFLMWQRDTAVGNLADWQANYGRSGGGDPRYLWNLTATASPLIDTAPESLIPSEFDRVGLLLSGSENADQAVYSDININKTVIQTMLLDVNTDTGAVSIRNSSGVDFDITYYEVTSANGNLDVGSWVSFDDGEGGDPVGTGWDEVGFPSANVVGELRLTGSLPIPGDGTTFGLGNAFNTATVPGDRDLSFFFAQPDGSLVRGLVNYISSSSAAAAVPEPGSLGLLIAGGVLLVCRRRAVA